MFVFAGRWRDGGVLVLGRGEKEMLFSLESSDFCADFGDKVFLAISPSKLKTMKTRLPNLLVKSSKLARIRSEME